VNDAQVNELLLQSLEHERGGVKLYAAAVKCASNDDLKEEWEKYLTESRRHVQVLEEVCKSLALDTEKMSPGRKVVAALGQSLLSAVETAKREADPAAAQIIAAECVVLAETKDHLDWELIGLCAEKSTGARAKALRAAYEEVEDQEDEHLYHTKGWCRELWIESLGMKAVLPPPEERKKVKTAIGAERAKNARTTTPTD
jgi:rubrerythrin